VKNRIVTKGKPTVEILHFVQNDIFFIVIFACLMQSLGSTNDEFCKLVNFSVFEKSIFSSGSRNDVR